jgi:hypothetical protein
MRSKGICDLSLSGLELPSVFEEGYVERELIHGTSLIHPEMEYELRQSLTVRKTLQTGVEINRTHMVGSVSQQTSIPMYVRS